MKLPVVGEWEPYHGVPDGCFFCPHHYPMGIYGAVFALMVVWDNRRKKEPVISAIGIMVSYFGWTFMWSGKFHDVWGAIFVLLGLTIATIPVLIGLIDKLLEFALNQRGEDWGPVLWDDYNIRWGALYLLMILVAWDDALQHAFGIWTPLDRLWKVWLNKHF